MSDSARHSESADGSDDYLSDDNIGIEVINTSREKTECKVMTPTEMLKKMFQIIRDTASTLRIEGTTVRLLLDAFNWDKNALLERVFESSLENVVERKGLNIHPSMLKDESSRQASRVNTAEPNKVADASDPFVLDEDCEICYSELVMPGMQFMGCGHNFCQSCWVQYVRKEVEGKHDNRRVQCPGTDCNRIIPDAHVLRFLRKFPALQRKFQKSIGLSYVRSCRTISWCPNDDCGFIISLDRGLPSNAEFDCPKCGTLFCFKCGEFCHKPVSCDMYLRWSDFFRSDAPNLRYIAINTKRCPNCKASIDKDGGCDHMTCTKCTFHFCWKCRQKWPHDHCPGSSDEDTLQERVRLERFLNVFDNYGKHTAEVKRLKGSVNKVLAEAHRDYDNGWIDIPLITRIVESLIKAHNIVAHTYVFYFFSKDSTELELLLENVKKLNELVNSLNAALNNILVDVTKEKGEAGKFLRLVENRSDILVEYVECEIWKIETAANHN